MFLLAQDAGALGGLSGILPILLVGAVFWFLVIRPQRKRQAERDAMLETISVGSEVVTIGGIFGEVEALDDNWLDLLVGEDIVLRIDRGSIRRLATAEDQDALEAFATGASPDDTLDDHGDDGWGEDVDDEASPADDGHTGA